MAEGHDELRENTKLTAKIVGILIGNGGSDTGVVGDLKWLKENAVTRMECEKARQACADRRRAGRHEVSRVFCTLKDVFLALLALSTILCGSGVLRLR